MRKMMLVVGAGLFAIITLPNTDSMAAETVVKKNFNLPKLVIPPPTGVEFHSPGEPSETPGGLIPPYPHEEGHDHDDSPSPRNAGNEQRRSPRP